MFKTEKHIFKFERLFDVNSTSGRYDTLCSIYLHYDPMPKDPITQYSGKAILHPDDQPDKINGKKIALKRAMQNSCDTYCPMFFRKFDRTEVWKAFWQWVSTWPLSCNVCGSQDIRDGICVDCLIAKEKRLMPIINEMARCEKVRNEK